MDWAIEHVSGDAAGFHARDPQPTRLAWVFRTLAPALVLGSTQPDSAVDRRTCERAGVDVVRRRSGGGAVLLRPGEVTWIDLVVPRGDPLWQDDVGRSMWWVGELWARSLARLGCESVAVHRGGLVTTGWSRTVCFDGLGPGEVTVGGAKAVGISQRRTAASARFQCAVYHRYDAADLVALMSPPRPQVDELRPVAAVDDADGLVAAVLDELRLLA